MAGVAGIQEPLIVAYEITGDASGGDDYVLTRAGTIIDVHVVASETNAEGTVTVAAEGNTVAGPIPMATADAVERAASIDVTFAEVAVGDTLTFTTNGAADRGTVYVTILPAVANRTVVS